MKKLILTIFSSIAIFSCGSAYANIGNITGNVTADNNLFIWTGSTWQTLGNNWEASEPLSLNVTAPSDVVYFAVSNDTNDSGNPAAFLGSFTDSTGTFKQTGTNSLLSNTANWQISVQPAWANVNIDETAAPTTNPASATGWVTPTSYGANSDSSTIWSEVNGGSIGPVDPNADWIWTANNDQNFDSPGQDNYAYISVDLGVNNTINPLTRGVVPEPPTFLLLAFAGALTLLFYKRKVTVKV